MSCADDPFLSIAMKMNFDREFETMRAICSAPLYVLVVIISGYQFSPWNVFSDQLLIGFSQILGSTKKLITVSFLIINFFLFLQWGQKTQ